MIRSKFGGDLLHSGEYSASRDTKYRRNISSTDSLADRTGRVVKTSPELLAAQSQTQKSINQLIKNLSQDSLRSPENHLKSILADSQNLKFNETKQWFRKQAKYYKSDKSEEEPSKIPRKYLMSQQEIKQSEIMEQIFKKIDSDGSGGLDIDELVGLFHDNKIHLDREVIKELFKGNEFTLDKFRLMIYNEFELNKFHTII